MPETPEESSSLPEENRLMLAAMSAGRAGDDARAVRILTELLSRHPTSPLAQNATVEKFRALKRMGDGRAASQAASRYLRDYPVGMASDEARGLAAEPKPKMPGNAFPR
jgi:outer membrane protein assembly factor BamD (BamD/ComL family)